MPPSRPLFVAEPAGLWRARPPAVVDCSVLVSYVFEEDDASQAAQALAGRALHAPTLLPFEFANVARGKSRAGAPEAGVQRALQVFDEMLVTLHPVAVADMHTLAIRHALTAYDAAYLVLAAALQAPLLTFDQKLADAAARVLGAPE